MIPLAYRQAWREHTPGPNPAQVQEVLINCHALCDLFNAPLPAGKIAFHGNATIHEVAYSEGKQYFEPDMQRQ